MEIKRKRASKVGKLPANNFEACAKGLSEYPKVPIPNEVHEVEKNLYHVIVIQKKLNLREERFEIHHSVKKFQEIAFEGFKKEARNLGYEKMFIYHDPSLPLIEKAELPVSEEAAVAEVAEIDEARTPVVEEAYTPTVEAPKKRGPKAKN